MIQEGQQFATEVANLRLRIDDLRQAQSTNVDQLVTEANDLINQIADLNPRISKLEASGMLRSDAGALRTQRYQALTRLSEIIPIRFQEREDGSIDLFTGSDYLILTGQTQQLETTASGDRNVTTQVVQLSKTGSSIATPGSGGRLAGIIEGRDTVLGEFIDKLDAYAAAIIDGFNRIHSSGEGLAGFSTLTAATRVDDPSLALNAAGLAFTPKHGSFQLKVTNSLTGSTATTNVTIDLDGIGSDTTLTSLRTALDGIANISATVTSDGRLKIDADANYEFRFADDTSGVLASLGINTFFTGSDSSNIGINSVVASNHKYLATSQGGGPGDGSNAVLLAGVSRQHFDALGGLSIDEFYQTAVANVAQASASEDAVAEGLGAFKESLLNQRDQFSGISLDEEAVKVLEFQRAFQASARLVSVIDELFTVLLEM
jgi:flagellar hook-associated protein 1 FlgK